MFWLNSQQSSLYDVVEWSQWHLDEMANNEQSDLFARVNFRNQNQSPKKTKSRQLSPSKKEWHLGEMANNEQPDLFARVNFRDH